MKIISVPHESLTKVSTEVEHLDKKLIKFIKELETTLLYKKDPEGVGLSAPQVDKNIRIFSTYLDHDNPNSITSYINPEIIDISEKLVLGGSKQKPYLEGCLSIPNIFGPVWRHESITIKYLKIDQGNMRFIEKQQTFKDFEARVIQHEYDHLEGILFTHRSLEQGVPLYREENGELIEMG